MPLAPFLNTEIPATTITKILFYLDTSARHAVRQVNRHARVAVLHYDICARIYQEVLLPGKFCAPIQPGGFECTSLNGGMTNTTYKITIDEKAYVVRFSGVNTNQYIKRIDEFFNASIATKLSINPTIEYYDVSNGTQVTTFLTQPEAMTAQSLTTHADYFAAAIKQLYVIHHIDTPFANAVDIFARNEYMLSLLVHHNPLLATPYLPTAHSMRRLEKIFKQLALPQVPCHNDPTPTNFIASQGKMYLIDWEYSGNNVAIWDLVCFAMEAKFTEATILTLLQQYYGKIDSQTRQLFKLLEPVYELWVALWAQVQIANANLIEGHDTLQAMANERFGNCQRLIASAEFQLALAYYSKADPHDHTSLHFFTPVARPEAKPDKTVTLQM